MKANTKKMSLADELRDQCDCERSGEHGFEAPRCVSCRAAAALEEQRRALSIARAELVGFVGGDDASVFRAIDAALRAGEVK